MSVWLTRPQKDSERMEAALAERGIESIVAPVMEVMGKPVSFDGMARPDGLVLTSRRAAAALASAPENWRDLPVYCVGHATAQAAQRYKFDTTIAGKGSALDLLPLIGDSQRSGADLLHLAGEAVKIDLAPLLAVRNISLSRLVVYETRRATELPLALRNAFHTNSVQGVVFYSPRSVRFAAELVGDTLTKLDAYCLSLDIAAEAGARGCKRVLACPVPTQQAMMELLSQHAMTAP